MSSKQIGLPYIKRRDIIDYVEKVIPNLRNPPSQISQALNRLSKDTKLRRKKIERYIEKGVVKGWTVAGEDVENEDIY